MMMWVDRFMWWLYGVLAWWCQAAGIAGLLGFAAIGFWRFTDHFT